MNPCAPPTPLVAIDMPNGPAHPRQPRPVGGAFGIGIAAVISTMRLGSPTLSNVRELFRLRNAEMVQVFSLRAIKSGCAEIWIDYHRRNRLERTERAGVFADISDAIGFVDARRALLNASGWRRV